MPGCGVIRYLVLACVVACYSPAYKDCEITCASGACPSGYQCEQGVCRVEGFSGACGSIAADAMIDGNPMLDTDGDGKNDAIDNCRTIANPDQANEDNDVFGNVCDPCPPFATFMQGTMMVDANADSDGDGVGNGCDPHPMAIGDRIRLFEGFAGSTTPTGAAVVGSWTFSNGKAHVIAMSGQVGTLYWTAPTLTTTATRRDTITTRLSLSAVQTNNMVIGAAILAPMDGTLHGSGCFNGYNTNLRGLSLGDSAASGATTNLQFLDAPAVSGGNADLVLTRDANSTRTQCTVATFMTPFANGTISANANQVGLRAVSSNADFDWLLWIDSPP